PRWLSICSIPISLTSTFVILVVDHRDRAHRTGIRGLAHLHSGPSTGVIECRQPLVVESEGLRSNLHTPSGTSTHVVRDFCSEFTMPSFLTHASWNLTFRYFKLRETIVGL